MSFWEEADEHDFQMKLKEQKMSFNREEAKKMLQFLMVEQQNAKLRLNEAGYSCTSAPYVIVKQYRDSIKKYCEVLRMNVYDEIEEK